ncbi:MAG: amidase [Thermomicrobiales bacterium]|nr:amidase [Thermomicrobiales bacterium]
MADERTDPRIPETASEQADFRAMMESVFTEQESRGALDQPPPIGRDIFQDESDRLFIGRELTLEQFRKWFAVQRLGTQPFNAVGFHHTEVPDHTIWAGMPSLRGVFNYYRDELDWPEGLGPQLWVYSGDGRYSTGSPRIYVGTHPAHDGVGISGRNRRWLHIEHIWNGDKLPFSDAMIKVSGAVLSIVCQRHQFADREIPMKFLRDTGVDNPSQPIGIMYHRDQNPVWPGDGGWPKSCPGSKVKHDALDPALAAAASGAVVGSGPSTSAFALGQRLVVASGPLNMRSAPGLAFAILAELEAGVALTVLEGPASAEGFAWYRVSGPEGGPGWVAGEFLTVSG